jgi:hypothetical protein
MAVSPRHYMDGDSLHQRLPEAGLSCWNVHPVLHLGLFSWPERRNCSLEGQTESNSETKSVHVIALSISLSAFPRGFHEYGSAVRAVPGQCLFLNVPVAGSVFYHSKVVSAKA